MEWVPTTMPDAANRQTALILGRGLITAESIYQDLRERLLAELAKRRRDWDRPVDLMGLARSILEEVEPAEALRGHTEKIAGLPVT